MNHDQQPTPERTVFSYDSKARITVISDADVHPGQETSPPPRSETLPMTPPPYTFEHEREKEVFRLKWSDGEVEFFRDKPTRYLVVYRYAYCSPCRKRHQPFNPAPMLGRKTDLEIWCWFDLRVLSFCSPSILSRLAA